jgi:hypothetical protein
MRSNCTIRRWRGSIIRKCWRWIRAIRGHRTFNYGFRRIRPDGSLPDEKLRANCVAAKDFTGGSTFFSNAGWNLKLA